MLRAMLCSVLVASCGTHVGSESVPIEDAAVDTDAAPAPPDAIEEPRFECPVDAVPTDDAPTPGDPWVCEQHDAQRTSRSRTRVSHSLRVRWKKEISTGGDYMNFRGLVIDAESNVYLSIPTGVRSFSRDGAERWTLEQPTPGPVGVQLALVDDVLFVQRGFEVERVSRGTGEVLVKRDLGGWVVGPVPGNDGVVYAAGMTPGVVALDRELKSVWRATLAGKGTVRFPGGLSPHGVSLAGDGSVLVATGSFTDTDCDNTGYLARYSSAGAVMWTHSMGPSAMPPSVANDGTLWASAPPGGGHPGCMSSTHGVYRFALDGTALGSRSLGYLVGRSPGLFGDGRAVVSTAGDLTAFTKTGEIEWRTPKGVGNGGFAIADDGVVLAGSWRYWDDKRILVEVLDGRVLWCVPDVSGDIAIAPDGTVFVYGETSPDVLTLTALR